MPRLAPFDLQAATPEQKRVAEAILAGPRGGLRGPFEAWLRSPELCDRAQRLGEYSRFHSSLPPHLNEIAILLTGRHWQAQFEFWAHACLAREAGVPEDIIEAIRTGETPPFRDDAERTLYDLITEYFATNRLSPETYARAITHFGEPGLVDIIGTVGYYGLVSMTLNTFEVPLPEGQPLPFPDLP